MLLVFIFSLLLTLLTLMKFLKPFHYEFSLRFIGNNTSRTITNENTLFFKYLLLISVGLSAVIAFASINWKIELFT